MTENKLTDKEIIQALECCYVNGKDCTNCPCTNTDCVQLEKYALDLINRQQAEIDRLQSRNNFLEIEYKNQSNLFWARVNGTKTEAIKEVFDKIKAVNRWSCIDIRYFDKVEKEMVGEDK